MNEEPPPRFVAPDCQDCGACCHGRGHPFVQVWGSDHARLAPDEQRDLVEFRGNACHMRSVPVELGGRTVRRCVALGVTPDGRWGCTIYERRPQACRDYDRGGLACEHDVADRGAETGALARDG